MGDDQTDKEKCNQIINGLTLLEILGFMPGNRNQPVLLERSTTGITGHFQQGTIPPGAEEH